MINDISSVNKAVTYHNPKTSQWYDAVQISSTAIMNLSMEHKTLKKTLKTLKYLTPDDYLNYLIGYYKSGLKKFKADWRYSDLLTHLQATVELIRPQNYLEIGVRRGRSLSVVARQCRQIDIVGFDLWIQDYAGMPNPGEQFVLNELRKIGHCGNLELISGDSSITVPAYFNLNKDRYFDLITVDGDHSESGALIDLENCLPRLKVGGVILLDDITHPQHIYLENLWDNLIGNNKNFYSSKYTDLGYGIACAVRRSF